MFSAAVTLLLLMVVAADVQVCVCQCGVGVTSSNDLAAGCLVAGAACDNTACAARASPPICGLDGEPSITFITSDTETCTTWAQAYLSVAVVNDDMEGVIEGSMAGVLQTAITASAQTYRLPRVWRYARTSNRAYNESITTSCTNRTSAPGCHRVLDARAYSDEDLVPVTCPSWNTVLNSGCSGQCVQDCINGFIFEKGEDLLEQGACDYVTGGAGTAFCSKVLPKILAPINDFVNKFIEKPIVEAADKVEDAVAGAAKKAWNFLTHWF